MAEKKTLAIDFDGVIHTYKTWEGIDVIKGKPIEDCREAMVMLHHKYKLVVHTCRAVCPEGIRAVKKYMRKHGIPFDDVTASKPAAVMYIDDRGLLFTNWPAVLEAIKGL